MATVPARCALLCLRGGEDVDDSSDNSRSHPSSAADEGREVEEGDKALIEKMKQMTMARSKKFESMVREEQVAQYEVTLLALQCDLN